MILAIDAGNTRIKWGVYNNGAWLARGAVAQDMLPELGQYYPMLRQAVISNVAGPQIGAAIQAWLARYEIDAQWVSPQAQACGVINGYSRPGQLGGDRWAMLVAAWHLKQAACVVASAGTALTIDALSAHGEFLGGFIVPGLAMMQGALLSDTAGVAVVEGGLEDFPQTTGDAVHSGALYAMAGAVQRMQAALEAGAGGKPYLLLAGGDAPALQAALSGAGEIVDNLVLEGLVLLAEECA